MLIFIKSIENLTDLNNIPKPCPYLIIMSLLSSFTGVAEHWVNLQHDYNFLVDAMVTSPTVYSRDNGDMSNKKEVRTGLLAALFECSPKAYGYLK